MQLIAACNSKNLQRMTTVTADSKTKFDNSINREFTRDIMKRVDQYFRTNKISRNANFELYFKTFVVFAMYLVPYGLMMGGVITSWWTVLISWFIMGLGIACIGLCVMHDANHGAYSKKKWVNKLLSYSLDFIGGSSTNWRIQHNYLHHTFTNIEGHDEDIAPVGLLRFSPHAEKKKIHRFQHIYAWFFYGLMTFSWVISKDFKQLGDYEKRGLIKKIGSTYPKELFIMISAKFLYLVYVVLFPILFTNISAGLIIAGFFIMHFTAGLILASIFQPAHVLESNEFPLPDEQTSIVDDGWLPHQLKTTADFAQNNKLFSWFVGGLNYQVEHHMFPSVCHVHYRKIAPIVKEAAEEYGLPYYNFKTFRGALVAHYKMLRTLGNA